MNSGSNWWTELVIFLATVELFLLVLVWKLVRKIKKVVPPIVCPATGCPNQNKIAELETEVARLKDAVLIAAPVMRSHAEPSSLAQFIAFSGRKRHD